MYKIVLFVCENCFVAFNYCCKSRWIVCLIVHVTDRLIIILRVDFKVLMLKRI